MTETTSTPERADDEGEPDKPACPQCGGRLIRMTRRAMDRALSLFVPVRRYRCQNFSCQWEGRVRAPSDPASNTPDSRR